MRNFIILLAAVVIIGGMGALLDSIDDFRSDEVTQDFSVVTSVGVTSANVVLAENLWDSSVVHATPSSNISEAVVANSYTGATRTLGLTGLSANTTRTVTVDYRTADLADYPGVNEGSKHLPVLVIAGIILIPFVLVIKTLLGR